MEIKYFNDGFVGKAVFNANEAIKCFNAGMEIRDIDGEYFLFDSDGSEPSESASVNLILDSLQENGKVYVGFCIEGHKVVPKNSTNLTCEFSEGQTVYFLLQGEIVSGEVMCVSLATSKSIAERGQRKLSDALRYGVSNDRERNCNFESVMSVIQEIFTKDCICIDPRAKPLKDTSVCRSTRFFQLKKNLCKTYCQNPANQSNSFRCSKRKEC